MINDMTNNTHSSEATLREVTTQIASDLTSSRVDLELMEINGQHKLP